MELQLLEAQLSAPLLQRCEERKCWCVVIPVGKRCFHWSDKSA